MAVIFPSQLPAEICRDPRRSAERRVYEAFSRQLDPSFHVYYSSPWLGTRPDGSEIDGEADFIVAHPRMGIMVIEVKGGAITVDEDGQWRSTDRYGITYRIKDPASQARASKYALIEKLRASPLWKPRRLCFKHSVILPDVERASRDLRPDMPLNIFAFYDDLESLDSWIISRFGGSDECDSTEAPGADGIRALDDLITRPIQLNVKVRTDVKEDLRQIRLLTEEQIWILSELEANRRMAIAGAAGTGKTTLAMEKTRLLANQGLDTLLLCYNVPLGLFLQDALHEYDCVTATSFHRLCDHLVTTSGRTARERSWSIDQMGNGELADVLSRAVRASRLTRFDAMVIDEGQDFTEEWLKALEALLKDGERGTLYMFYDDNQNVMSRSDEYVRSLPVPRYRLSRNFRNTKRIFSLASNFYTGDFVRAIGPEGRSVQWHTATSIARMGSIVNTRIEDLIDNGISPEQIAVIAADRNLLHAVVPDGRLGNYSSQPADTLSSDHIVLDTIRRFKGLESPVILLLLDTDIADEYEILYTGMTRAQTILEVIGPERVIQKLRRLCASHSE